MKTWLVAYESNYGTGVVVVNADTAEEAVKLANVGWTPTVTEIDTTRKGIVAEALPSGG